MNRSFAALALATLTLGSTSVYLYTELHAEAALRRDLEARLRALEATRPAVEQHLETPTDTYLPARNAVSGSVGGAAKAEPEPQRAGATVAMEDTPEPLSRRLANPEERQNMVAGMKGLLRVDYKDLPGELNLSTEQADQLLSLLAEQRLAKQAAAEDPMTEVRREQVRRELEQEHETELMALLGGKYMQYEEYENTLYDRREVEQLATHFAAANLPLSENLKRELMTVMVDERKAKPMPADLPAESERIAYDENITRQREWQQDYDRRVLERMSGTLTPQELKQLEELQRAW